MTLELRQRLLGTTLLVSASLFAAPAFAQDATPEEPLDADTTTSPVQGTVAPTTSADASPADTPADIVITGSRIPQPNLTSSSPVTVVSSQEVKLSGVTRVEDLLNSLPQVFAGQTSTDANGATGIATVNLRGLGSQRTLVLINGRRLMPGDVATPVADINFIPGSIVKRVDVLTGGASSVYGSDALAGVVNFIMDTTFTGIRVDAQGSFYQHKNDANDRVLAALDSRSFGYPKGNVIDGGQQEITVSIGADLGGERRGHVLAYAGYRHVSGILQADRDFSSCGLSGNFLDEADDGFLVCAGSSTNATGRFRRTRVTGTSGGLPVFGAIGPNFTINQSDGAVRPYTAATDAFNFNPYNHFQRPDERYVLGAFADYEISSGFHPYMEAMFMNDRSVAAIAPSGAFYGTDFFINCANPLIPTDLADGICIDQDTGDIFTGENRLAPTYIGRRNVEGGPRVSDLRHTDYRLVAGMKGDIMRGLAYDVYGQYGAVNQLTYSEGDFSRIRLNRALDVIDNPNTVGVVDPVCRSAIPNADGVVIDSLCVPYNIFQPGGVTQAAVNYLGVPNFVDGDLGQNILNGVVTFNGAEYGLQTPWAQEGIGLAIGAEYRKDTLQIRNDVQNLTGDIAGSGAPNGVKNAKGFTTVKEIFGEANIPLASGMPGFHELALSLSGRHSSYNLAGTTDSYKIGLEYAPTPDIRARASYNRAVRAPNVLELFTPQTVVLFGLGTLDPCGGGLDPDDGTLTANGGVLANCLAQFNGAGVTEAQALAAITAGIDSSPANQYYQRAAGNPDLIPETSDSYTLGLVLTPRFLPGFNATIDAFDIEVVDSIQALGAAFILAQCSNSGLFCDAISRSADGSLFTGPSFVDNPSLNLGGFRTRGIDVAANYRTPALFGNTRLQLSLVGTYLDKFEVTPLPGDLDIGSYDCAGLFGDSCGTPNPEWRHRFRVTVPVNANLSLSAMWRYFSKVTIDYDDDNELIGGGSGTSTAFGIVDKIPAQSYFDLALQASFERYSMRMGVNNILDREPPITPNFSNNGSNAYSNVYDSLGRYIFAGVTVDF